MDMRESQALGKVEGKVDLLLSNFSEFRSEMKDLQRDQTRRIESLEQWRSRAKGYSAGLIAATAVLVELVRNLLL